MQAIDKLSDTEELYLDLVGNYAAFFVPNERASDFRIWIPAKMFLAMTNEQPGIMSRLEMHHQRLLDVAAHCDLPRPNWLQTACFTKDYYAPSKQELEAALLCLGDRMLMPVEDVAAILAPNGLRAPMIIEARAKRRV